MSYLVNRSNIFLLDAIPSYSLFSACLASAKADWFLSWSGVSSRSKVERILPQTDDLERQSCSNRNLRWN